VHHPVHNSARHRCHNPRERRRRRGT
jgi:hypothetical protein